MRRKVIASRLGLVRRAFLASAISVLLASQALAQDVRHYDIPAQDAASALREFGRQSGLQVLFPHEATVGRFAPEIQGKFADIDVLNRLAEAAGLVILSNDGKTVALGNEQKETSTRSEEVTEIDAIVVTAQRREESMMTVPLAVTALSQESIQKRGLIRADDYLRTIPSVVYRNQGPGLNTISIRGAYGDAFRTGPTVGVYFGDIPLTGLALGGSTDIRLIDVERVEVLRGPQGTLYGSNSLSGTVRNIPNRPYPGVFEGSVNVGYSATAGYGSGNSDIQGVLNIPMISDLLTVRAVGYNFESSPFIRNVASQEPMFQTAATQYGAGSLIGDRRVGGNKTTGARFSALLTPIEGLSIDFNYIYQKDSADSMPFALRALGKYRQADYDLGPNIGVDKGLATDLHIKNLTLTYDSDWGSFVSSSSIIDQDFTRAWTIGAFFPVNGLKAPVDQLSITEAHQFTQEVRFASEFDGPFQIVAGGFYDKSRQPSSQVAFYEGTVAANNPFAGGTLVNRGPDAPPIGSIYGAKIDRRLRQIAGFGEVSFDATESLKLTAGIRYFEYRSTFITDSEFFSYNTSIIEAVPFVGSAKEDGATFKAAIEYSPNKHSLIYGKFSQGFRLGRPKNTTQARTFCDLNDDGTIDGTQLSATDPLIASDRIDAYEVGGKLSFADGRGNIRAATYRNDWKDIPITISPDICPLISIPFNGGTARAQGFELEGDTRIGDFRLDLGVGYVNSKLTSASSLGTKGAQLNFAPEWNAHIGVEYGFDIGPNRGFLRGDYTYFDQYWIGIGKTGTKVDAYSMINASVGIDFVSYDIRLYVDNLFNSYGITTVDGDAFVAGAVFPLRPRTVGIRLGAKF